MGISERIAMLGAPAFNRCVGSAWVGIGRAGLGLGQRVCWHSLAPACAIWDCGWQAAAPGARRGLLEWAKERPQHWTAAPDVDEAVEESAIQLRVMSLGRGSLAVSPVCARAASGSADTPPAHYSKK